MDLNLTHKTALVTGGSSGLGMAICQALLTEGARAWSASRSEPSDSKIGWIETDLANPQKVQTVIQHTQDAAEANVDILINCAGYWPTHFVKETTLEDWQHTLNVNLTSLFVLCRDFVNQCQANDCQGNILNVTSQAAFGGATSGHADYAAAKAGVVNFTKSLAREVASDGIRVNAIAPGMMQTPMTAEALANRQDQYIKRIPLGRIAAPAEVADVAVFLCSEKAGYMTGTTVDVSGGMIMR